MKRYNKEDDEDEGEQRKMKENKEENLARGETVLDDNGKSMSLGDLREESRRAYLKKREKKELKLLQ